MSELATLTLVASRIPDETPWRPTKRQLEILECIARGMTYRGAALHLGISVMTVKNHMYVAYARMGAANNAHAVALAFMRGYLTASTLDETSQK